eukprot:scaffold308737_cov17-Tisochrysis_lutea.AAC.1
MRAHFFKLLFSSMLCSVFAGHARECCISYVRGFVRKLARVCMSDEKISLHAALAHPFAHHKHQKKVVIARSRFHFKWKCAHILAVQNSLLEHQGSCFAVIRGLRVL